MNHTFISDEPAIGNANTDPAGDANVQRPHLSETLVPALGAALDRGEDAARDAWTATRALVRKGTEQTTRTVGTCATYISTRPIQSVAIAAGVSALATAALLSRRAKRSGNSL
jgi:ElaB/YqjD/DUF883 family membrane-anchored ribosome-binding protein